MGRLRIHLKWSETVTVFSGFCLVQLGWGYIGGYTLLAAGPFFRLSAYRLECPVTVMAHRVSGKIQPIQTPPELARFPGFPIFGSDLSAD